MEHVEVKRLRQLKMFAVLPTWPVISTASMFVYKKL